MSKSHIEFLNTGQEDCQFKVQHLEANDNHHNACCVFMNSGRVSAFDGEQPECRRFAQIKKNMLAHGISCIEFDLPVREASKKLADEQEIAERYYRLKQVLAADLFQPYSENFSMVGLSLGGQVILKLITDEVHYLPAAKSVNLLSTVVDQPCFVQADLQQINLVYGSRDIIVYLDGEDIQKILRPDQYARQSCEYLVKRKSQHIKVHILSDVGHLMDEAPQSNNSVAPESYITQIVATTLLGDKDCRYLAS